MPGCGRDIGVGGDGTAWVIGCSNDEIWRWNGSGWDKTSGAATNISVDLFGNPAVANRYGSTYWINSVHVNPITEINNHGTVNVKLRNLKEHHTLEFMKVGGMMTPANHWLRDVNVFVTNSGKKFYVKDQGTSGIGPWGKVHYTNLI